MQMYFKLDNDLYKSEIFRIILPIYFTSYETSIKAIGSETNL